jgi:predicted RNA-binding protein
LSGNQSASPPSTSGKWLLVATSDNWKKCLQSKSWGVKEKYKHTIQRMKVDDEFIVHLTENKTAGICKVTREYYYDTQPTWGDGNFYPHRIGFEPVKVPAKPIDAKALYDRHLIAIVIIAIILIYVFLIRNQKLMSWLKLSMSI